MISFLCHSQVFNCDSAIVLESGITYYGNTTNGEDSIDSHPYFNGGAPDWQGKEVIHKITAGKDGIVSMFTPGSVFTGYEGGCIDLFVYPSNNDWFVSEWIFASSSGKVLGYDSISAGESRYFIVDTRTGCEESEYTLKITFPKEEEEDTTTGINNIQSDFLIYPNPAKYFVNIETESNEGFNVEIFNLSGIKLHSMYSKQNKSTLNVSNLNAGMYILKINYENKIILKKIIKH